jgi:hypothetical protein
MSVRWISPTYAEGTAAERAALTGVISGTIFYETDTPFAYIYVGGTWRLHSIGGAGHVYPGIEGEAQTRRLNALATTYARATNGADFTAVGGVREIYITLLPTAAFTNEKKAIATFDAPNEATAAAWLSDTGGQAINTMQTPLQLGIRNGPFAFSAPIDWVDIATDVAATAIIEGVTI